MPEARKGLKTEKVGITNIGTGIVVDREPFRVSKKDDESRLQVEWICKSDGFTVEFTPESPFANPQDPENPTNPVFRSKGPGSVLSGRVRENVKFDGPDGLRKSYKYTVTIGKKIIDPTGQVDP
jgi:hypothetical protein